jgi:hypothetical protein
MSKAGRDINGALKRSSRLSWSDYDMSCTCYEIAKLTESKRCLIPSESMNNPTIELKIGRITLRILIVFSQNVANFLVFS